MDKKPPLLFLLHDDNDPRKSQVDARAIASHVSARYKPWKKSNRTSLALDSTTKAILMSKQPTSYEATGTETSNSLTVDLDQAISTQAATGRRYSGRLEEVKDEDVVATVSELPRHPLSEDVPSSNTFPYLFASQAGNYGPHHTHQPITPEISKLGLSLLDPFTSTSTGLDHDIISNLHFYFKVIRPFALHLIDDWEWLGSLPYIQASPALTYAVAAYASLFQSGCLEGGPGVVLPPPVKEGGTPLWPVPVWFQLQTRCLAELNPLLADSNKVDETCYQAILLLFRIAILLADGKPAQIHYRALKGISVLIGRDGPSLEKEMAVAKVNIVDAFLHNSCIVVVKEQVGSSDTRFKMMVEIDRKCWQSDRDWHRHHMSLGGRLFTLRADRPWEHLQKDSADAIARIDPQSTLLTEGQFIEIQYCHQIALYLSHYLNAICYDTGTSEIRTALQLLHSKLSYMNLESTRQYCNSTLFHVLLQGAMASRGHVERAWFVRMLSDFYPDVQSKDNIFDRLDEGFNTSVMVLSTVEEVWDDVLRLRATTLQSQYDSNETSSDDWKDAVLEALLQMQVPVFQEPDLTSPVETIEVHSLEGFAGFHFG